MDKFKIGVVYELEKEHCFANAKKFKIQLQKKYDLTDIECSYVYCLIVNYQVEQYGGSLNNAFLVERKYIKRDDNFKRKFRRK